MTDDKIPVDPDKLFALLGRSEFTLHVTAHALARSEEIRARLEEGSELQNDERNRLLEKIEDLRARHAVKERDQARAELVAMKEDLNQAITARDKVAVDCSRAETAAGLL